MRIFGKQRDFEAFEEVIEQAKVRSPMRVLAWSVFPITGISCFGRGATATCWSSCAG